MTSSITVREVSELANSLTAENIEAAVAALDPADVPVYLSRLVDAAGRNRVLTKALERRLAADGQEGQRWTIDGLPYSFQGAQRKGYDDFPGLVRFLIEDCGIAPVAVAEAVTDARVTDLRQAAERLTDPEKREAALAEIDAHRIPVGTRGEPRFSLVDERYVSRPVDK